MLKIGVPSKGRLMEDTFAWFGARGVTMRQTGGGREYAGAVEGIEGVGLVLLSAGEIPREMAAGRVHLGVTGADMVQDRLPVWREAVMPLAALGFGHADLVIAVPAAWIDVETVDDLDAAAAAFRAAHGHRLRIATKYHRLVRDYLTAEAIADITTTGETLRANHLKVLSGPPILSSEATLYAARNADWSGVRMTLQALAARLGLALPATL